MYRVLLEYSHTHSLHIAPSCFVLQLLFLFSPSVLSNLCNPRTAAWQPSLSFTIFWSLLKLTAIESVIPSNHLILCHPLLLLPSIVPSIRVISKDLTLHIRWSKYWSFSFIINPSNEHKGLISFRINWCDIREVQGTLKSFLQHHSSKASIFQRSALFMVQLSHAHMTTGKTRALTRWTLVGKIMSLLFTMLSKLVITFLPRSMYLLISWQSLSAVILEPPQYAVTFSIMSPSICHEVKDQMPWS